MGYYPVFLDLKNRPCVVIGTGPEARRKALGLLEAEAQVTCIDPHPCSSLEELAGQGKIDLVRRQYSQGDLEGVYLAILVPVEDSGLAKQIAVDAASEGVLLNAMDIPDLCSWIAPAVVHRGNLAVAVSTGGKSPAMARLVKGRVEEAIPKELGSLLEVVAEVRKELHQGGSRPTPDQWQAAINQELEGLTPEPEWRSVRERLLEALDANIQVRSGQ